MTDEQIDDAHDALARACRLAYEVPPTPETFARAMRQVFPESTTPPPAPQADAEDGARWREFCSVLPHLPITYLGEEYSTQAALNAAVDAARQAGKEGA